MKSIIDPPTPFAPAAEWRTFAAEMEAMSPDDVEAMAYLAEARERAIKDASAGKADQ